MVRFAASVAAVTILAGTALAQYTDDLYERSVSDYDYLEARSESALNDYLVAREAVESKYGRDLTNNEKRAIFEIIEARDPLFFSLIKTGVKMGVKGAKKGAKGGQGGGEDPGPHLPLNIDKLGGLPPSQRSLAEDEALYGRDYADELETREPLFFSLIKTGVKMGVKGAKKGAKGGQGGGEDPGPHLPLNIDKLGGLPPSQRSLAEDDALYGRGYDDYDLEAREPLFFSLIKTGVKMGVKGAKKGVKGGQGGGEDPGPHLKLNIDQLGGLPPSQRSLAEDDALYGRGYSSYELKTRGYDDIEDLLDRDFEDYFDDLD